ncbi:hypothetical protein ISCGN_019753 [Ixodes scapularis]
MRTSEDTLKQRHIEAPVLANFDASLPTQVYVDASHVAFGAVLVQVHGNSTRVVEYASKKVTDTDSSKHSTELEAIAAHWAITDRFHPIIAELKTPGDTVYRKHLERNFQLANGILMHVTKQNDTTRLRTEVPKSLRNAVLRSHHDDAGHGDALRTKSKLERRYHWSNMDRDITQYVRGCKICQQHHHATGVHPGTLNPRVIPTTPFDSVAIDHVGPINTDDENKYFITAVNLTTRFIVTRAVPQGGMGAGGVANLRTLADLQGKRAKVNARQLRPHSHHIDVRCTLRTQGAEETLQHVILECAGLQPEVFREIDEEGNDGATVGRGPRPIPRCPSAVYPRYPRCPRAPVTKGSRIAEATMEDGTGGEDKRRCDFFPKSCGAHRNNNTSRLD